MKHPLFAAAILAFLHLSALGQTKDDRNLHERQVKSISRLLRENRPSEAEAVLQQLSNRSGTATFQLGDLRVNQYAFLSQLLINTYLRLNEYTDSERVARDRVEWAEKQFGPESRQKAGMISLLAAVERLQLKYKEAEPLYVKVLAVYRSLSRANCLLGKELYTGLAETYVALDCPREAASLLAPLIAACKALPGKKKLGLSDLLNAYAIALEFDDKPKKASDASSEADRESIYNPRYQQEERDLLRGRLRAAEGQFDSAIETCRRWISVFERTDGPESDRRLMRPLGECERISRLAGRTPEADAFRARLSAIRTKYQVEF